MRYCVILAGRLPGEMDDAVIWAPVAAALKLDTRHFAERVLAALPLVIRQDLDEEGADRLAGRLRQTGVDARVLPDDLELAYLERDGRPHGPLPLSGLGEFIEPGQRYRLRGSPEWQAWPAPGPAPADLADADLTDAFAADATAVLALLPSDAAEPPAVPEVPAAPVELPLAEASVDEPPTTPQPPPPLPAELPSETPIPVISGPPLLGPPPVPPVAAEHETDAIEPPVDPPASLGDNPTMRLLLPVGRSGLAIAAGYLGLLALTVVIAPITLLVSLLAWRDLKRHPEKHGWGRTIFGLVMGILFTVLLAYVLNADFFDAKAPVQATTPHALAHPKATAAAPPTAPAVNAPAVPKPSAPATATTAASADTASGGLTEHCESTAPEPRTPEERILVASGQRHLVGKALRGGNAGDVYVVEAALGYDGMCRPSPYQIYVFHRGEMAGTLAPSAMQARSDGAIVDFRLVDPDHLQIDIDHYRPEDPLCCASGHEQRVIALSQFGNATATPAALPSVPTLTEAPAAPAPPAPGASSRNCSKATSPSDKAICADDRLRRLDTEQAKLYQQALADASPDRAIALKASQQEWLQMQPQLCATDKACMERGFNARIETLKQTPPPARAAPVTP
jgi:uncharacterized protein YecT (DUF1311 family)